MWGVTKIYSKPFFLIKKQMYAIIKVLQVHNLPRGLTIITNIFTWYSQVPPGDVKGFNPQEEEAKALQEIRTSGKVEDEDIGEPRD